MFSQKVDFEPVSLKRHRHRLKGGTYDPSKKDKELFLKAVGTLPEEKMTQPLKCKLDFYCKRPKNHFRSGKKSNELKEQSPKYNTNNKDLDNMVKFVLDALNDKLYGDDSQVVEIHCKKLYIDNALEEGYIFMQFEEIIE